MEKKTSLFDNGLIWFGAGVSLAEILTGTYFPPGIWPWTCGYLTGTCDRLRSSVFGRRHRRKQPFKCYGDSKEQFRQ